mmetsp:Transcript_17676/g.37847  ORF Transcript_17676/g.37847 Transcript_17676/m.37847 type:complete len:1040 (-) Transcript_17676:442-3561(-)|eukprot:CAMPEP_0206546242 /NCGR_PEP_ID=MMETSP0325_2-20121206/12595_1 /ASSEMBLY_ACC=CAM_ASM_000347 /TAXON_ID=2866 /ORGANISM="Crypthecodinium cohnii, Strain Seligo" /LENGTH=1039 /DNA_ID=CAMNT_0054045341 /DNA_START=341 /DNA_END=3460 /DNA_ORIENTATION=+
MNQMHQMSNLNSPSIAEPKPSTDGLTRVVSGSSWGHQNSFLVNDVLDKDQHEASPGGATKAPKKKGALSGVFVPTCENMWGVLIFLRFYYIVGEAGVLQTMLLVFLSFAVALCTTASMSSIASSGGFVSGGGPYYMISRALGPVLGASVGIMYWLAVTMLAVLECLGAIESLLMAVPQLHFPFHMQALGSALMALIAGTVWGGINVVTKLGVFFALVVAFTLFSYYYGLIIAEPDGDWITGLSTETLWKNWTPHYDHENSFGTALGLFYPCFTGILSGANRADVLKNPPKNIKRGTYAAICFSFVMYVSLFLLWGAVADYKYLQGHVKEIGDSEVDLGRHVVAHIVWNPFPYSAFAGIIIASISQSLQCLIVAPRLLQQIAKDDILKVLKPLAPLSKSGEPTRALLFTYVVSALCVLMGKVELVAPLLAMCFLVAYAFMNCSCFVLTLLKSPAWRPDWIGQRRYRVLYLIVAGLGSLLCPTVMFLINPIWAAVACVLAVSLYAFINVKLTERGWGSAIDGIRYRFAIKSLMQLESRQAACVNWRPQVLILYKINLSEEVEGIKHHEILKFSSQLRKSRGFCVVACVLESERRDAAAMQLAAEEKDIIQNIMHEEGVEGFAEVVVAPTWKEGSNYIIQLTGIGGLVPNTILLDWPNASAHDKDRQDFMEVLQTGLASNKAVCAIKGIEDIPSEIVHGTIDIWWMIHDGGFLILLSWLLAQHRVWRSCHLRVFTVAENVSEERATGAAEMLSRTLRDRNLCDVDVEVLLLDDAMIEPYTYDWTLRVEERHRFLQQLNPNARSVEPIPYEIDDLFDMHEDSRQLQATEPSQQQQASSSTSKRDLLKNLPKKTESEEDKNDVKVSDCRTAADKTELGAGDFGSMRNHEGRVRTKTREHLPATLETKGAGSSCSSSTGLGMQDTNSSANVQNSVSQGGWSQSSTAHPPVVQPSEAPDSIAAAEAELLRQAVSPFQSLELCNMLGGMIHQRSKRAQLVVMNLPDVWGTEADELLNYVRYCDTLTKGLERVLFVHSSGKEIFDITI